jgi:HK97 family phage prohead protease/HK97 family phage major capsid protein
METREIELRLTDDEGTIAGIAVPYDQEANIGGQYVERFAPGAIDNVNDVKIFYGHDHDNLPIGKVISGRDTEHGYEITAKLTRGVQRAEETLALMRDGVLNKFSVGFIPVEQTREGNTITRTRVNLLEVSVVNWPAYSAAAVTSVREEQPEAEPTVELIDETTTQVEKEGNVSENTELDVRAIQDELTEVRRLVEANATPATTPGSSFVKFRSQGEYAKALVSGDETALELYRTYTPATSADTYNLPGWVGFINNLINLNRPSWSVWSRAALPEQGLTVDYAKVTTNGISVTAQANENDAIAQGNLVIDNATANVKTYAGQTVLSKQLVERSTVPYLDTAFQAMAIAYASATNAAVVTALAALDYTGKVFDADGGTAKSVLEGITDAAKYIKVNSGLNPEFILCDPVAYKYLVSVADAAGRLVVRFDGAAPTGESLGAADPRMLTATIFGMPIVVDTTLSSGLAYIANSAAVRVFESAGAPVRLVDDISGQANLQNSYAVYGYGAVTVPFEGAIAKLDVTA